MGVVHKCGGPRRCGSSSAKQTEHNMKNDSSQPGLSRRRWFAGAGTVGAVAAVAAALPATGLVARDAASAEPPEPGSGYRLTEHVRRYYQTTRI
jgi:hypothetical protein